MRIGLEDDNVTFVRCTVNQARDIAGGLVGADLPEDIALAFDEAQGEVHMGNRDTQFLVIQIELE